MGLAAWNVVPVYFDHYDFVDKVNEICRTPRHVTQGRRRGIMKMLMDEVAKRRLAPVDRPGELHRHDRQHDRQIELYYEREVEILPGWKKTFKFEFTADQPLI